MTDTLDGIIIGLEWIVRTGSTGTDNERFDISGGALNKETETVCSEGLFDLPAGYPRVIGRHRVVLANHIGVARVIHEHRARLPVGVLNFNNANFRIDRSERDAIRVF